MQPPNVLTLLPARARRVVYILFGLVSLLSTATMAAYTALPNREAPDWLVVTLAVLGALAGPIGVLAASNTPGGPAAAPSAPAAASVPGPVPGTVPGTVPGSPVPVNP
jgi:hypothetical protein